MPMSMRHGLIFSTLLALSFLTAAASPAPPGAEAGRGEGGRGGVKEEEIFRVFSGTDVQRMAKTGTDLESERPHLDPALITRMLKFMAANPDAGILLDILRPMLVGTVAGVIGKPAEAPLRDCLGEETLRSLCETALTAALTSGE